MVVKIIKGLGSNLTLYKNWKQKKIFMNREVTLHKFRHFRAQSSSVRGMHDSAAMGTSPPAQVWKEDHGVKVCSKCESPWHKTFFYPISKPIYMKHSELRICYSMSSLLFMLPWKSWYDLLIPFLEGFVIFFWCILLSKTSDNLTTCFTCLFLERQFLNVQAMYFI